MMSSSFLLPSSLIDLPSCFTYIHTHTADGYCVELGHLEPHEKRGQILATGQFIRFMTCVFAGGIQSFLLNGYVRGQRSFFPPLTYLPIYLPTYLPLHSPPLLSLFLYRPSTNDESNCPIRWNSCWTWGLTMAQYYYLMFCLVGVLVVPMLYMKEAPDHSPHRTMKEFAYGR